MVEDVFAVGKAVGDKVVKDKVEVVAVGEEEVVVVDYVAVDKVVERMIVAELH